MIADRSGCCGPTGSGALEKVGTGTLTLSGSNTYTGTTLVEEGALIVDGSIASSSGLTVGVDGTIGGTGVLPSTTVYGTLSPGNSIGTLTVNGDLTLAVGSTYRVELSSSGSDLTHVTGTATLGGTLAAVLLPGETAARRYTVLTADGGLSGSFSDVTLAGLPSWYTAVAGTLGDDVVLDITLALAGIAGLSGDQRQVAATLDRAFDTGPGLTGLFADVLAAPSIPAVLTQLSGEIATGATSAAFRQTDQFLELMLDPFAGGRGAGPAGGPALAFAPAPAGSPAATAVAGAVKAPPDLVPDVPRRWRVWGGGFGGDARYRGDAAAGSHDLSVRNWGLAGGADYRAGPDLVLGLALAGGETAFSLGGLGSGRGSTIQVGGYGSWRAGAAYVSAAGTWGAFDVTTDRTVTMPGVADRLNGAFTGQGVGGRVETGMRLAVPGDVGVTPFAAVTAQAFRAPAHAETDAAGLAGFALAYAERTTSAVRSELGARFDAVAWRTADAALTLRGRLGWAHEFSTERAAVASFVNLSPAGFTVLGASPAADAALVSAGAELTLSRGVTLRAGFDGQLAGATQIYSGTGSLAVAW
nr:autotransporter outer membrane beta-barrel domain-containing protein [Rhodoplanes tepidamans]